MTPERDLEEPSVSTISFAPDRLAPEFVAAAAKAGEGGLLELTLAGRTGTAVVSLNDVATLEALEDDQDSRLARRAHAEWVSAGRALGPTLEEGADRYRNDVSA